MATSIAPAASSPDARDIPRAPGYLATPDGRIWRRTTSGLREIVPYSMSTKPRRAGQAYLRFDARLPEGGRRRLRVHRVVGELRFFTDELATASVRDALNQNETIFRYCRQSRALEVYEQTGADPFDAVSTTSLLPAAFHQNRYPRMREQLAAKREARERARRGGAR